MNQQIQDYIDAEINYAKLMMEATGNYRARLHHVYEKDSHIRCTDDDVYEFLANDNLKKLLVKISHQTARVAVRRGSILQCAFLISDAYVSIQPMKPEHSVDNIANILASDYISPSADPKRHEGLMLCVCFKDSNYCKYFTYERQDGIVIFDGKDLMQQAHIGGGYFSKLFPPDLL